ncbi:PREDICTED: transposon, partial [Prunus dulcis]
IKLPKFKQYRRDVDLKNPEFRLGMKFANKKLLIEAIKELAIIEGREVYGSKISREEGTFAIKTLSLEHQCGRVDKLRHTTSKWLCDRYANKLKRNSDFDLKSFQQDVLEDYKINVTKLQVYRAKRLARDLNEGTFKEQYARLWDYAEELKTANKGSTVKIKTQIVKGETGFLEGCRPVIGVDGCHLKGPYPGQILTTVGVDGNNDSWIWFFNLLIEDLGITNEKAWVVISDKQKGLVPAIERVLPTAEHMMCVRHLYSNFRASYIGLALKHILWAAARATTVPWWEAEIEKMKNEDEEAW